MMGFPDLMDMLRFLSSFTTDVRLLQEQVKSMRDCLHPMADGIFTTNVEGVDVTFRKNGQELYFGSGSTG